MPKRSNPFGDQSSLQLKTHVGEKEVDKGVNHQVRMQSVYEKTNGLLFSGMKQKLLKEREFLENNNNNAVESLTTLSSGSDLLVANQSQPHMRQMHINNQCQLVDDENEMETESVSSGTGDYFTMSSVAEISQRPLLKEHHSCDTFFQPIFGAECVVRSPGEISPPGTVSPSYPLTLAEHADGQRITNVFMQMQQAQRKAAVHNTFLMSLKKACHNCRKPVQARDVMKCQFCENYVCGQCISQCGSCHLHFCQLCSVLNYDQTTERAFCLTCNGK